MTRGWAQAVAAAVRQKSTLRRLNLRENELEDKGAIWIATALSSLSALETVDLTQNQVCCMNAFDDAQTKGQRALHSRHVRCRYGGQELWLWPSLCAGVRA